MVQEAVVPARMQSSSLREGVARDGMRAALFRIRAVTLVGVTTGFARCAGGVHRAGLVKAGIGAQVCGQQLSTLGSR